jgi:hypothetical protein
MEHTASIRKSALIVALAGSFITPFMGSSINIALPEIGRTFAIDAVLSLGGIIASSVRGNLRE